MAEVHVPSSSSSSSSYYYSFEMIKPSSSSSSSHRPPLVLMDRLHELQCHAAERQAVGALPEAIHAWSALLRQLLPYIVADVATGLQHDDDDSHVRKNNAADSTTATTMALWVAAVAHNPTMDDAIFALFPYVLVYTAADGDGRLLPLTPGTDARRVGAGVAYNLALAYHMRALQGSATSGAAADMRCRAASLRTALGAYKAARDMLLAAARKEACSTEDDRLLLLAITNNEGQICEALHERGRVAKSLRDLRRGLEGAQNPSGICGHFTITDALFGDLAVVQSMHSAAA